VGDGGGGLAADDGGGFVNEGVVGEGFDHEEGEVDAASEVAFEDGVADVAAPDGEALALAFLEVASADDGPAGVALEDAAGGFDLVVDVGEAGETADEAEDGEERLEATGVAVLAIAGDVPAAGEDEAGAGLGVVEDGPGCARGVAVDAQGTRTVRTPSQPATAFLMTSESSVAPGTIVMRSL
jgi:hypothetical protein